MPEGLEDWRRATMGEVLRRRDEGGSATDPLLSVTFDRGVVPQSESGRRDTSNDDKSAYHRVYPGDIVYNTMRMWQGVSARSPYFGIVSPAYTVCKPTSDLDTRFMAYVLRLPQHVSSFKSRSQGLVSDTWSLKFSSFKHIAVSIPSLSEQRRIAEVLTSVDGAIHSTERLLAKLATTRTGILADLTKYAEERGTSGAESRWPILTLGSVADIAGGVALGRSLPGNGTVELPYLRVANVQDGNIDTSDIKHVRVLRSEVHRYSLRAGDFLMTEGGDFDKLGRGAVWDGSINPCLHQNHIFRVRTDRSRLLPGFLAIYAGSHQARRYFVAASKQTTNLATINMTQVRAFPMPVPLLAEQEVAIRTIATFDERTRAGTAELSKLRGLKQGLMEDLLTGRMRVKTVEDELV